MEKPYTLKFFVPDGNPNSLKIIEKMNWTGVCLDVSRESWSKHKKREQLERSGIYILYGYTENEDLPTCYIGQSVNLSERIEEHGKKKNFWQRAILFTSNNNELNQAHIAWLERELIAKAYDKKNCILQNSQTPTEKPLSESEKADIQLFLNEILSILPVIGIKIFEDSKKILRSEIESIPSNLSEEVIKDTIVVSAYEEGFQKSFIDKKCWYAIRISSGKLPEIKYLAVYRTNPIKAITHYGEVESIEEYGSEGKYKLLFKKTTELENSIPLNGSKKVSVQGSGYTTYKKLINSKNMEELYSKNN